MCESGGALTPRSPRSLAALSIPGCFGGPAPSGPAIGRIGRNTRLVAAAIDVGRVDEGDTDIEAMVQGGKRFRVVHFTVDKARLDERIRVARPVASHELINPAKSPSHPRRTKDLQQIVTSNPRSTFYT